MLSSKWRHATLVVGLVATACDPYTRSTVIQMRSAADVAVQDVDSPSRISPNDTPSSAEVARTEVATGPGSTSDLIVIATRRPGGAIVTEWQTRLPLVNGERHVLVDATGAATLDGHQPIDTTKADLVIPVCGTLRTRTVKSALVGYEVSPGDPCEQPHMNQINLETPRSNLQSIHYVSTNDSRGVSILVASVMTLAFGGLGAAFAFADLRDKDGNIQGPGFRAVGVGLMAIGASIDIALLPSIFAPNKDEVVYP
jgi:hypothetical protein